MCEWLSRGEWCDVQLLCGGRSFSAHRVVLASVSTFLRRILLSCPSDETTFIVLPDFDLEAMSSVLFYIYNGEVIMQKQKVGLFLDIIRAMQIHIDYHYLSKIQEDTNLVLDNCVASFKDNEIYTLGLNNDTIFNIKRCKESQRALLKYSQSDSNFHDNNVRCQNESEPGNSGKSRLGNLKSPCESRQRNSLLRDLFIETYPRNGNANGLTESVLAISNECYHSPGSELSANANCRHLIEEVRLHTPHSTKASGHSLHASAVVDKDEQHRIHNYNQECTSHTSVPADHQFYKFSANQRATSLVYSKSERSLEISKIPIDQIQLSSPHEHNVFDINTLVLNHKYPTNNAERLIENSIETKLSQNTRKKLDFKARSSTRVIFNQVLENPWNARKPNNYRPFRRKDEHSTLKDSVSDKNNNLQDEINILGDKLPIDNSTIVENRESFKCTHCDQVFTSTESKAVHMRRHSTNARYTCGECGKTFSQLRNFKYHMSIHRGTREFAATCTVCGKYFNDRGYLSSHMKIHRNRKEYKCSLCPKSFNQRVAYNMHVRIHTGVKPHVCEECGKAFSRKMLLKQHQRTHSGERPYACPHCDKRFADRSNMTLHLRLHTGVKPFSCPMCPKSFTKKHHLKSHLNFHTGSKPYSCPRCNLAFTQSSNMRTHFKKCTASEPSTSNDTTT